MEIGKTTEALSVRTADLGDDKVGEVDGSRIVIAKGPGFLDKFMAEFMVPRRWDTAQLALSALIQSGHGFELSEAKLVEMAFKFADEMMLTERSTLDARMAEYWKFYLSREGDAKSVMDTLAEESKDYSL